MIGLVILILKSPAMQRRNPKTPVIKLPQKKTDAFEPWVIINCWNTAGSPLRMMSGMSKMAAPALLQYANWIVELLQWGKELLIRTAWKAMNRDDIVP